MEKLYIRLYIWNIVSTVEISVVWNQLQVLNHQNLHYRPSVIFFFSPNVCLWPEDMDEIQIINFSNLCYTVSIWGGAQKRRWQASSQHNIIISNLLETSYACIITSVSLLALITKVAPSVRHLLPNTLCLLCRCRRATSSSAWIYLGQDSKREVTKTCTQSAASASVLHSGGNI